MITEVSHVWVMESLNTGEGLQQGLPVPREEKGSFVNQQRTAHKLEINREYSLRVVLSKFVQLKKNNERIFLDF